MYATAPIATSHTALIHDFDSHFHDKGFFVTSPSCIIAFLSCSLSLKYAIIFRPSVRATLLSRYRIFRLVDHVSIFIAPRAYPYDIYASFVISPMAFIVTGQHRPPRLLIYLLPLPYAAAVAMMLDTPIEFISSSAMLFALQTRKCLYSQRRPHFHINFIHKLKSILNE